LRAAAGLAHDEQLRVPVDLCDARRHLTHRNVLGAGCVTALPLVVLAHVEQDHGAVERRGNIGDLRLRYLDLVHGVHADTVWRRRSTAEPPKSTQTHCQQFRAIHNFHRFIHSPSAAETRLEPPNLWACWELLWITLRGCRPTINRPMRAERNGLPR
jgi:hypothetical protein